MRMENENGVGRFEFGLSDLVPSRTQTLFPWRPAHSSHYAVPCHARPYLARPWPRGANGTGWNDGSGSAPCSPGSAEVWQRERRMIILTHHTYLHIQPIRHIPYH